MINLRTAPACARVAVGVALSAALSAAAVGLIAAPPTSASSSSSTTSTTTTTTTTTSTTTTTTATAPSLVLKGETSQRRPISFRLSFASIEHLHYRIVDRCPHGRHLFVHSWGFPPLAIANSHFGGKFVAKPPAAATTTITGKIDGTRVTGSLSDRTRPAKARRFCAGTATFSLAMRPAERKPAPQPGPSPHRRSHS
ncbi:MAG: hypothetical protein ACJ76X_17055 [Solirubrobacteraceae bacterium]|jgi:hypothetical protein